MATVTKKRLREFGSESNGPLMTPAEFDQAAFVEGWRYELINGLLVVSPPPLEEERDANDELGYWLRRHRNTHPEGNQLDATLHWHTVCTPANRRYADRVIWAGLGRKPRRGERPTIVVEFVSAGKRDRQRDCEEKRDEYMALGIREYLIFDRFERTLTVYIRKDDKVKKRVLRAHQKYRTDLLPGFELPLERLFALAEPWQEEEGT
jgi:Uma2 family endonuclease